MHRSISIIYPKMEGHSMIYFGGPARSPGSARHGSNFRMHACAAQGAKNHGLFGVSVRQPTLGEPRAVHICAGHKADCLVARGLASSENQCPRSDRLVHLCISAPISAHCPSEPIMAHHFPPARDHPRTARRGCSSSKALLPTLGARQRGFPEEA